MTPTETADILRQFNDHRRGCDVPSPKPSQIGRAIDAVVEMIERLEAAEKERDWNAERLEDAIEECTALRAKIETAENDAAHQKALAASALRVAEGWERKCGELRAKVEQLTEAEAVMRRNAFEYQAEAELLHPTVAGDRYAVEDTQEKSK